MNRARRRRRTFNRASFTRPTAAPVENRQWYRIENNTSAGTADIHVYDEIGYWGISAQSFVAELRDLKVSAINLHINSPGGEIFDGIAIMNALRAHPAHVTTHVDGIAASIASVIAMAGDKILMAPHSQLMIHDGSGLCIGNAADMRVMADLLDRQSDNIAGVYASRAGGRRDRWRDKMRDETWYTAEEAVEAGLADEVTKQTRQTDSPTAQWDLTTFRYQNREHAPAPDLNDDEAPAEDTEQAAEEDGEPPTTTVNAVEADPAITEELVAELPEQIRHGVTDTLDEAAPAATEPEADEPTEVEATVAETASESSAEPEPAAELEPEPEADVPALENSAAGDEQPVTEDAADAVLELGDDLLEALNREPDPWAEATQHLTEAPDPDAEFARLTEAMQ